MDTKLKIAYFQRSIDRLPKDLQQKLAKQLVALMGFKENLSAIEIPQGKEACEADFIYNKQSFQVTGVSQEKKEKMNKSLFIKSLEEQRKSTSNFLNGGKDSIKPVGGSPIEDIVYTIKNKFDVYGGRMSEKLILVVEFVDMYQDIFDKKFQPTIDEIRIKINNLGIIFKDIYLAKRSIINDEPAFDEIIKI